MGRSVVIVQDVVAQYRVEFYDGLRLALRDEDIELHVVAGRPSREFASRGDTVNVDWIERSRDFMLGSLHLQIIPRSLRTPDLIIVEHASRHILNYWLVFRRRLLRGDTRLAFWGHGRDLQAGPKTASNRLKQLMSRFPDWWFAYTEGSAERVVESGFPRDSITVVQNSQAVHGLALSDVLEKSPLQVVYIGALYENKRIGFLLGAGEQLAKRLPGFRLVVAGDGPLRGSVENVSVEWLEYVGPTFGEDKARLLASSCLMLVPGLVGLAVIDSFAFKTPIVTTAVDYHSPEFEYLEDSVNGVVLHRDCNEIEYADYVADLLLNSERMDTLREGCDRSREFYSLEAMVKNFTEGVRKALS